MTRKARNNEPRIQHEAIPFHHRDSHAHPPQLFDTVGSGANAAARSSSKCTTSLHQCAQAPPRFAQPFTSHGGCIPCWLESQRMYKPNCIHRRS
ncbi:hypothetical protein HYQ46_011668 [Verticillium longisporum]|nr:hypothetical protein HYQ46_011668 [Verticillium longisporum]